MSFFLILFSNLAFSQKTTQYEILQRITPVGKVNVEGQNDNTVINANVKTTSKPKSKHNDKKHPIKLTDSGKKVYTQHCQLCHAAGLAGAPKLDETANWQQRLKQGVPTLVEHVIKGYKAMPARGGCSNCTDSEIKAAVLYMLTTAKVKQ